MKDFWHKNVLKSNCPKMHVALGLQLLTPARSASQRPRSMSWSQVFFFLSPLKQQRKKKNKTKDTRDDSQGSTHVLGFRRTCCYGNAGCSLHARSRVRAVTPSPRRAAEDACERGSRGPGPPNSPRGDRLSQEHFLLPHGGRVGAPEAVFAALLPDHRTENPR